MGAAPGSGRHRCTDRLTAGGVETEAAASAVARGARDGTSTAPPWHICPAGSSGRWGPHAAVVAEQQRWKVVTGTRSGGETCHNTKRSHEHHEHTHKHRRTAHHNKQGQGETRTIMKIRPGRRGEGGWAVSNSVEVDEARLARGRQHRPCRPPEQHASARSVRGNPESTLSAAAVHLRQPQHGSGPGADRQVSWCATWV